MTGRSRHDELRERAGALLQYVSDGTDGLMTPGMIHLSDAADVLAVVMAVPALLDEVAAAEARADEEFTKRGKVLVDVRAERARADKAEAELAEYTTDIGYKAGYEAAKRVYAARADKATQALAAAVAELEVLSEHDRNHDGFDSPAPVDKADCRLCRAIALARDVLGGVSSGTQEPAA